MAAWHNGGMHSAFTEAFILGLFITFVTLILAGFFQSVGKIVRMGWEQTKLKTSDYVVIALAFVGFACFGYGLAEPYSLQTTRVSITSKKIAPGSKPIRIVHITDLHFSFLTNETVEQRLVATIKELRPDLIVFTGDAFNDSSGAHLFRELLRDLPRIAPFYCVRGNHDYGDDLGVYDKTSVRYLGWHCRSLTVRGNNIWIAGVGAAHEKLIDPLLSLAPEKAFTMFLYHYPVGLRNAVAHNIDLFCGGHTHGGQVRLPWYGAILTNSELGKQFEYGLYKVKGTSIFISRGIGTIAIPVRFLAPPEVAVIDVCPESTAPPN